MLAGHLKRSWLFVDEQRGNGHALDRIVEPPAASVFRYRCCVMDCRSVWLWQSELLRVMVIVESVTVSFSVMFSAK
jgi:hypothetical protein